MCGSDAKHKSKEHDQERKHEKRRLRRLRTPAGCRLLIESPNERLWKTLWQRGPRIPEQGSCLSPHRRNEGAADGDRPSKGNENLSSHLPSGEHRGVGGPQVYDAHALLAILRGKYPNVRAGHGTRAEHNVTRLITAYDQALIGYGNPYLHGGRTHPAEHLTGGRMGFLTGRGRGDSRPANAERSSVSSSQQDSAGGSPASQRNGSSSTSPGNASASVSEVGPSSLGVDGLAADAASPAGGNS